MRSIYYLRVRIYPTMITVTPFFMFSYYLLTQIYHNVHNIHLAWLLSIKVLSDAGFLFLSIQINRFIAKELFIPFVFKSTFELPTVKCLMLSDDSLPLLMKMSVREAISKKLSITLSQYAEELTNEAHTKVQISHAIAKIRELLRNNGLIIQHDIEYKFIRNLIGGCFHIIIFSSINVYVGYKYHDIMFMALGFYCLIHGYFILLFSKSLLKRFSKYYAMKLYQDFLNIK